jgi:hypothetical protein
MKRNASSDPQLLNAIQTMASEIQNGQSGTTGGAAFVKRCGQLGYLSTQNGPHPTAGAER